MLFDYLLIVPDVFFVFTDGFSGPGRAISRVCISVCVWAITFAVTKPEKCTKQGTHLLIY